MEGEKELGSHWSNPGRHSIPKTQCKPSITPKDLSRGTLV